MKPNVIRRRHGSSGRGSGWDREVHPDRVIPRASLRSPSGPPPTGRLSSGFEDSVEKARTRVVRLGRIGKLGKLGKLSSGVRIDEGGDRNGEKQRKKQMQQVASAEQTTKDAIRLIDQTNRALTRLELLTTKVRDIAISAGAKNANGAVLEKERYRLSLVVQSLIGSETGGKIGSKIGSEFEGVQSPGNLTSEASGASSGLHLYSDSVERLVPTLWATVTDRIHALLRFELSNSDSARQAMASASSALEHVVRVRLHLIRLRRKLERSSANLVSRPVEITLPSRRRTIPPGSVARQSLANSKLPSRAFPGGRLDVELDKPISTGLLSAGENLHAAGSSIRDARMATGTAHELVARIMSDVENSMSAAVVRTPVHREGLLHECFD